MPNEPVDPFTALLEGAASMHELFLSFISAGFTRQEALLSEEERAKGFVRPVRRKYIHTTCGTVTTMSQGIAETYARNPKFYGGTYCVKCQMHKPVHEFLWDDDSGQRVGE